MAEVLHGDATANQLNARNDKTQVYGLKGNDTLTSGVKSDVLLVGGSGDDSLIMSGGNGTLSGGEGKDTFELTYSATKRLSAIIEDLDPANDKIIVNFDGNTAPQLSSVTRNGNVILRDSSGNFNATLKGVRDNDYFDGDASNEAWEVLWLTNAEREKKNLPALTLSEGLTAGAEIRVKEITNLGQDGALENHRRPDGTLYYTVLNDKYDYPGENLDGGAESPSQVMNDWIGSASHYKNIMDSDFQKLGVGYNYFDIDESNHRWYWTQLFAKGLSSPETLGTAELLTATPEVNVVAKNITLAEGDSTISNNEYGATIQAQGGSASIANTGLLVSISGNANDDTIDNSGSFVTINAGAGDDSISLGASTKGNVIEYAPGDGNDTVYGFNDTSTLSLASDDYYFPVIGSGKDVVVTVGDGKITLVDAAKSLINTHSPTNKILRGTESNDTINNLYDTGLTIQGSDGNDSITNSNTNVSISGGEDDDTIKNYGNSVSITGDRGYNLIENRGSNVSIYGAVGSIVYTAAGLQLYGGAVVNNYGETVTIDGSSANDMLVNYASNVTINGGAGGDRIHNHYNTSSVSIVGGAGGESISNYGTKITISGGDGNDAIDNYGASVSVDGGAGADTIGNAAANVTISAGDNNDYVRNDEDGSSVSIDSGAGDDTVGNFGSNVTITSGAGNDSIHNDVGNESVIIEAGAGDDYIENMSPNVTINGELGDDTIRMGNNSQNELILYKAGDGNDVIRGFNDTSTLSISGGSYTPVTIDGDIILEVGTDYIELLGAVSLSAPNITGNKVEENRLITLTEGDDFFFDTVKVGTTLEALGGDDFISNSTAYVTMSGGTGDDYLSNSNRGVSINGDAGNDEINNYGDNVTIEGGAGNDSISLDSASRNHVIRYAAGDGSDTISGFNESSILDISNADYTPATVGNDVIVTVGDDSIMLNDAATLAAVNIIKTYNNTTDGETITGTDGDDYIINHGSSVSIDGLAGKDSIGNGTNTLPGGDNVTISGNSGDDYIVSDGSSASIDGGDGADTLRNNGGDNVTISGNHGDDVIFNHSHGSSVSIDGGAGDDTIDNHGTNVTITTGEGNDTIQNGSSGSSVSIDAGANDDLIQNFGSDVTINGAGGDDAVINSYGSTNVIINGDEGNDQLINNGSSVTMTGGEGNDSIATNFKGSFVSMDGGAGDDSIGNHGTNITITGGTGNDTIYNDGSFVSISGGAGDDSIRNELGSNVTIIGGAGNDSVYLSKDARNVYIQYNLGDGNDTVWNFSTNDTLNISADSSLVSSVNSGNDVIYTVDGNTILLKDGRDKPLHIIIGESGTSGGGGGTGGGQGGGSSSGGSGGSGGGNTSGGTSAGEGHGSDASGGSSASGRGGSGSGGRGGSSSGGGGGNTLISRAGNYRPSTSSAATEVLKRYNEMLSQAGQPQQPSLPAAQHVYTGGNQVISNYQSGEKIIFGAQYTGAFYDGAGNFLAGSSTGALAIQNAADKVIDLSDAAGNAFVKAYAATTAGLIDGRGIAGFELINGSAGSDTIFAGDGGSQLWGGGDNVTDVLVGGNGADIFIGGRMQGTDLIVNASSADVVHLNDATLSDIVATAEDNGVVAVAFNTGSVIAAQSTELLSSAFVLSDGSAYRYNHVNKNWQTA